MGKGSAREPREIADAQHVHSGSVLADVDPGDTSLAPGDRARTEQATAELVAELTGMQERLYAEGVGGGHRSLLLLLQGMDTSGKDGTVRRVVGAMNPAGVTITSFKKPTSEELQHDFLWRIDKALPAPGPGGSPRRVRSPRRRARRLPDRGAGRTRGGPRRWRSTPTGRRATVPRRRPS